MSDFQLKMLKMRRAGLEPGSFRSWATRSNHWAMGAMRINVFKCSSARWLSFSLVRVEMLVNAVHSSRCANHVCRHFCWNETKIEESRNLCTCGVLPQGESSASSPQVRFFQRVLLYSNSNTYCAHLSPTGSTLCNFICLLSMFSLLTMSFDYSCHSQLHAALTSDISSLLSFP